MPSGRAPWEGESPRTGYCDLHECALERCARDSAAAVVLVDEDAGDPPAGRRWRVLRVLALMLEREFLRRPVLAPALREFVLVEDQGGMRAARS